jgi:hypothetical protein
MSLYDSVIAEYPELVDTASFYDGTIILQNDADEAGDYIKEWNYSKPIPAGLKLGK